MSPLPPVEQRRLDKATRIADVLEQTDMKTTADLNERAWKRAAWEAGTKPPSERDKEMVGMVLAVRERIHNTNVFALFETD